MIFFFIIIFFFSSWSERGYESGVGQDRGLEGFLGLFGFMRVIRVVVEV